MKYKNIKILSLILSSFIFSSCSFNKPLTEEEKQDLKAEIDKTKVEVIDPVFDLIAMSCIHYYQAGGWPFTKSQPENNSQFDVIYRIQPSSNYFEMEFKLKSYELDWKLAETPITLENGNEGCSYKLNIGKDRTYTMFNMDGSVENDINSIAAQNQARQELAGWANIFLPMMEKSKPVEETRLSTGYGNRTFLDVLAEATVQAAFCALLGVSGEACF